jgi:cytochrome c peroxidase
MHRLISLSVACLTVAFAAPLLTAQADVSLPNPPTFPDENPMLENQDILGKFLFWEEQMSGDNTMACGTCHIHEAGGSDPRSFDATSLHPGADGLFGTDDDVRGSSGVVSFDKVAKNFVYEDVWFPEVQVTGRKTPTAINAAHFTNIGLFWDGRATEEFRDPVTDAVSIMFGGGLEHQSVGPPTSPVEMGGNNQTWPEILTKLETVIPMALATNVPAEMLDYQDLHPNYPSMFKDVYGDNEITGTRVAFAIANYERTLISDESLIDLDLSSIQPLPPELQDGLDLFNGVANCAACHTLPFMSDLNFHNIGLRPDSEDIGLEAVTLSPFDKAKFKTPNIRNAKHRVPLFHNGSADTVQDVIDFYGRGGDFNENGLLDENMLVLDDLLTPAEMDSLVLFLEDAVNDPRVPAGLFPFTRPTLRSELAPTNTQYGVESLNGEGVAPTVLSQMPGNLGHAEFLVGVADATPGMKAVLAFGFGQDRLGTVFPDPRFPVPINIQTDTLFLLIDTTTDAFGVASASLPLPMDPAVDGLTIYAQWIIADPDATDTGGLYGSKGIEIPLFLTSASL